MKNIVLIVSFFGCASVYASHDGQNVNIVRTLFAEDNAAQALPVIKPVNEMPKSAAYNYIMAAQQASMNQVKVKDRYQLVRDDEGNPIVVMQARNLNPNNHQN